MDPNVEDLTAQRQSAKEAARSLGLTRPWLFEEAPASSDPLDVSYLRKVDDCDVFLLIVGSALTEAVKGEFQRAVQQRKPRLVFVKSDREARSSRTVEVADFINTLDTRYKQFYDTEELSYEIRAALADELIIGYRRYNVSRSEFDLLLKHSSRAIRGIALRSIGRADLDRVRIMLSTMRDSYPDLVAWTDKKLGEGLESAEAFVSVAEIHGQVVGVAISSEKGSGARKLSTLFVQERFRGMSIGSHLLYGEIQRAWMDGVRKLQISFSEERKSDVLPLLYRYGFLFEGISPARYRPDAWEIVMGKVLVAGSIDEAGFLEFVRKRLFTQRGHETRSTDLNSFIAEWPINMVGQVSLLLPSASSFVYVCTRPEPENEVSLAKELAAKADKPLVFITMHGWPGDPPSDFICLDGYDLQSIFFPLQLASNQKHGLVCSIREEYARELIPSTERRTMFPSELQLRTDNVYYRAADRYGHLRRGVPILFYVTSKKGGSRLAGEALLAKWEVGEPMSLFAKYGNLGIYRLADVEAIARARGGKAVALKFDWFREYERPLDLALVRGFVPKFNPISAWEVDYDTVKQIRGAAGWK